MLALSLDPLLNAITARLAQVGLGDIRAAADDLGLVLKAIASLSHICSFVRIAAECARLLLQAKKCLVIPIAEKYDKKVATKFTGFLDKLPAPFKEFAVVSKAKYLGY